MNKIFIDLREFSVVPNFENLKKYDQLFVGNGTLLGSNVYTHNLDKVYCMYDKLNDNDTKSAAKCKSKWVSNISEGLESRISSELSSNGLSPLLARSFFYLLFSTFGSYFDAVVFFRALMQDKDDKEVTIAFGGDYSLPEILTISWWLELSNFLGQRRNDIITFEYYVHQKKVVRTQDFKEVLSLVSGIIKKDFSTISYNIKAEQTFKKPTSIICLKNCKNKHNWLRFIQSADQNDNDFIIIDKPTGGGFYGEATNVLSIDTLSLINLKCPYAVNNLLLKKNQSFTDITLKLEKALVEFCVKNISKVVKFLSIEISRQIETKDCKSFFLVDCPSIECLATHQIAIEKSKLPTLIPHSFTAIHEYNIQSYSHSYSYSCSRYISPHTKKEPNRLKKETVFNVNDYLEQQYRRETTFWHRIGKISRYKIVKQLRYQFFRRKFFDYVILLDYKLNLRSNHINYGYIANAEMDRFNNEIHFKQEISFLFRLNKIISKVQRGKGHLFIRGKKSYFPTNICKKFFATQKPNNYRNPSFDTGIKTLEYFGKNMCIVFFITNTSAILELMLQKVLCIKLEAKKVPCFVPDYIDFPMSIVPKLTLKELKMDKLGNIKYLNNIKQKQYEWAKLQVIENKR